MIFITFSGLTSVPDASKVGTTNEGEHMDNDFDSLDELDDDELALYWALMQADDMRAARKES